MKDEIKEKIKAYYVANDIDKILNYITNLQEKLEVSQTNEETYRLEMQDITKCLGLKEDTIFDEVKEYATNLQEERNMFKDSFETMSKNYFEEKSRNEKAIRYIERCRDYHRDIHKEERIFPDEITSLLMILNGGDEE